MTWFRNIVLSGLSDADEYQKYRGILLSNYISLSLCGVLFLLFFVRRFVFGHVPGGVNLYFLILGLTAFGTPVLLNRAGLTTVSRLMLCYLPVCFLWYFYISQF